MPDMFDPNVSHVVFLPQWACRVSAVHSDAVQHQQLSRHTMSVVPDVDGGVREHVGHDHETGRGVRIGEGGML